MENVFALGVCKQCDLFLSHPISLPCGQTICKDHIDQTQSGFRCRLCSKQHTIPEDGFQETQLIVDILKSSLHLSTPHKEFKTSVDRLEQALDDFNTLPQPYEYIAQFVQRLQTKANEHKTKLINEIVYRHEQILMEIGELEIDLKAKVGDLDLSRLKYVQEVRDSKEISASKTKLREPKVDPKQFNVLAKQIQAHYDDCLERVEKYKSDLLFEKSVELNLVDDKTFGSLINHDKENNNKVKSGSGKKTWTTQAERRGQPRKSSTTKTLITVSDDDNFAVKTEPLVFATTNTSASNSSAVEKTLVNETTVADFEVKRGPGRPRKSTTLTMVDSDSVSNDLDDHNKKEQMPLEVNDSVVVKRGKGRPRKSTTLATIDVYNSAPISIDASSSIAISNNHSQVKEEQVGSSTGTDSGVDVQRGSKRKSANPIKLTMSSSLFSFSDPARSIFASRENLSQELTDQYQSFSQS